MKPKKTRDRKRQTKINFTPAANSSPQTTATTATTRSHTTATTPTKAPAAELLSVSRATTKKKHKVLDDSSSEDEFAGDTERGMRLGVPISANKGMFGSSNADMPSSGTSEDEKEKDVVVKPGVALNERGQLPVSINDPDQTRQANVSRLLSSKRRRPTENSDESDDELHVPTRKYRKTTRRQTTSVLEENSEEDEPVPANKRRRIGRRRPKEDTDEEEVEWSDRGDDNEGREDDNSERDDLKEDLAFLRSSPLPDRGKLRSTQSKPMNERQKALEALKKRRAGTKEPYSSAASTRTRPVIVDDDESESELEIIKEEDENGSDQISDDDSELEDEESDDGPSREATTYEMFREDGDDEAFIDDAVDNLVEGPILEGEHLEHMVNMQFSVKKPKELFKYAIEWMVMKKIHPAFDSQSEVYKITFHKLDDEVKALAGSKFSSSVWTPEFMRSIRARPDMMMNEISGLQRDVAEAHCEACNRKNHPASQEVMFTGSPYDKDTLEPLQGDSDSESDSGDLDSDASSLSADSDADANGEKPAYDAYGERLAPESRRFTLGSTCAANAQVSHTLLHWRYQLYSWVKDYLAREGYLTAEKLVKRDGWRDRKREKAAEKIVKKMEEMGEVRKLYRAYKEQVSYALEVVNDQKHGWGRR